MRDKEIKAIRERLILKDFFLSKFSTKIKDVELTNYNGFEKYDATWTSIIENEEVSTICEVKVRNYPLTSYSGWIIEKDKYDYLMNSKCLKKLYINFHPDGYQIWDLEKATTPTWKKENHRYDNNNFETVEKMVGDLNSSEAVIKNQEINIYEYLDKANNVHKDLNKKQK